MTDKDLIKIRELLKRTQELPDEIIEKNDFNSILMDDSEERKLEELKYYMKRDEIYRILDDLILETRSFIKLKFGKESEYWNGFNSISFDSKRADGIVINTFNVVHNEYWSNGKNKFYSLLRNIEAEIKITLETTSNELELFKSTEKRKLDRRSAVILFLLIFGLPIAITAYFLSVLVNWTSLSLNEPLSWINNENFGKLEFLLIVFEFCVVGLAIFVWRKYRSKFKNYWYNKFKLQ